MLDTSAGRVGAPTQLPRTIITSVPARPTQRIFTSPPFLAIMNDAMSKQQFQTEVSQLLQLIVHSLYVPPLVRCAHSFPQSCGGKERACSHFTGVSQAESDKVPVCYRLCSPSNRAGVPAAAQLASVGQRLAKCEALTATKNWRASGSDGGGWWMKWRKPFRPNTVNRRPSK